MAGAAGSPHRRSNGGHARARALSGEERSRISKHAALARHAKARHAPCPIPRLDVTSRHSAGIEPNLMLPVDFVRRLGFHKDLLRWFMPDADHAPSGISEGDVLIVAAVSSIDEGALHALARDGGIFLGRVRRDEDGLVVDAPDHGGTDEVDVVGRVVGRMGRFGDFG